MAQHDYVIANGTGAAVRSDLNNGLAAIVSNNSGATEPATMYAYQWWPDTTTGLLKIRNSANNAWVTVGTLASVNLGLAALASPTFTGTVTAPTFTASTAVNIPLGSAGSPTLFFTGDSNTGLFSPGADAIALATAGTNRLHITSGGLVGIGTTSPNQPLHVNGDVRLGSSTGAVLSGGAGNNVVFGDAASPLTGGTAFQNTAIGYLALSSYTGTGFTNNTAVGHATLRYTTSGVSNTALGFTAGTAITTGNSNTLLGAGAGSSITTGSNNVVIGGAAGTAALANTVLVSDGAGNERFRCDSSGRLLVGTSTAGAFHILNRPSALEGNPVLYVGYALFGSAFFFECNSGFYSAAATAIQVCKNTSTNRSINAGGTVNASGADYAEYMTKSSNFTIAKGDICGVDASGKLTNIFADSVSFLVKSTDPSYVGGDTWGTEKVLGPRPSEDNPEELTAWEALLEEKRQMVDRIAFAGQVPVNVMGAAPSQYIVPVEAADGGIEGIAKSETDLTLAEYMRAIGKVIAIEDDGRARIIVKVA